MKFAKLFTFLGLIALLAMTFTACDEDSTTGNDPMISSVSPNPVDNGATLTINGNYFGAEREEDFVVFTAADGSKIEVKDAASYVSWSDDKIEVTVPDGALSGTVHVNIRDYVSNKVDITIGDVPQAIGAVEATSVDATTISVLFEASPSDGTNGLRYYWTLKQDGTVVSIDGVAQEDMEIPGNGNEFYTVDITGLTEGEEYTFEVYAKFDNTNMTEVKSVTWSPASRYELTVNDSEIEVYESSSSLGSGLDLYYKEDVAGTIFEGPQVLTVGVADDWNLGLKTEGDLLFGSASLLNYNFTGTPNDAEICNLHFAGGDLDAAFNDLPFNDETYTWSKKMFDLEAEFSDAQYDNGVIIIVRVMEPNSTAYNYAKVLLRKVGGEWLQGSSPDRYIDCRVSYQRVAGVPYASPM